MEFVTGFAEALASAKQTGKPLMVFFDVAECQYCRKMRDGAFRDPQIVRLSENFICVRIEADEAPEICENFHIEAFPTVQFITPDGAPLHRVLGKKEPEALAVQMQAALQGAHAQAAYRSGVSRY